MILKKNMGRLIKKTAVSETMTFDNHDKLNRKKIAEKFNLLFGQTSHPFVIALDNSWGTGKTQFIHMWRNLLEDKDSVYLNLWEEDFMRNPFLSLIEALSKKFEEKKVVHKKVINDFKKIAWELARGGVGKIFGADINDIASEGEYKDIATEKEKFKLHLENLANKIKENTKFPLFIFIDELDRCRPNYAVEFLEIAKHFFNIKNIIFILGIDMKQLVHSIKSLYGQEMDSEEYLRKFIDIKYSFPEPSLDTFLDTLFSEFECEDAEDVEKISIVKEILKKFNPPLRAMENFFMRLNLIDRGINDNYIEASFLLALKLFSEEEYRRLIDGKGDASQVTRLEKYFINGRSVRELMAFWKISNDLILKNSSSKHEYLNNLKLLLNHISKNYNNPSDFLQDNIPNGSPIFFSMGNLLQILKDDPGISHQPNITMIENIFHNKKSNLKNFEELTRKIDFLEDLDFSAKE